MNDANDANESRDYLLERVADAAIVQLYADDFTRLPLREKRLIWHLYEAALAGRDIYYDQRSAHNLEMRAILEAIIRHPAGVEPDALAEIVRYTKLFWIHSGPFNHLTARKFVLRLAPDAFARAAHAAARQGAAFPLREAETLDALLDRLAPAFFDAAAEAMVTNKTPGPGGDILRDSANNLYAGVSMADLDEAKAGGFAERYDLNSRLVKRDGQLVEEVYRLDGMYGDLIARIVSHLEAAVPHATDAMAEALRALIRFYRTGETDDRRAYDIAWVADQQSPVDTINGFVEVYMDPRGHKGAWESLVFYVNEAKTRQSRTIAEHAQWFEDRMPWEPKYRKPQVTGVTARAIDVVVESGEAGPLTPIGINLPNDQDVRQRYGSKSVSLSNVLEAYERSSPIELKSEFAWSPEEVIRAEQWGPLATELTIDLHEIIGHGSGLIGAHLNGNPQGVLQEQYSALEETRADLVALYFIADPKLVELGLIAPEAQQDVIRAEYEGYARTALVQLRRLREGTTLEEDHMRNRQAIVHWLLEQTTAIERRTRGGKTYLVLVDAAAFRAGAGRLLAEIQRIKAEGDYPAAVAFFERYGIHVDPALRDEVLARTDALNLPAYTAYVQPKLEPVYNEGGDIADVRISYPRDLTAQMLEYSDRYGRYAARPYAASAV
jgi:dipeptidyl-peptidase-3